jgi:hypothetical protein
VNVVAIVSVVATAIVGLSGVLVPALIRRGDRQQEVRVELQRAGLSWAAWVRDKRESAYDRLFKAIEEHKAYDDNPQSTKWNEQNPPPGSKEVEGLTPKEMEDWRDKRQKVLASAISAERKWASKDMYEAWSDLEEAASSHDTELCAKTKRQGSSPDSSHFGAESFNAMFRSGDTQHVQPLRSAREKVVNRVALDLQGVFYYGSPPSAFVPTDTESLPADRDRRSGLASKGKDDPSRKPTPNGPPKRSHGGVTTVDEALDQLKDKDIQLPPSAV